MSGTFNIVKLAGHRSLVTGDTDEQKVILDSTEWDHFKENMAQVQAAEVFDDMVAEFFAPLAAAAETAEAVARAGAAHVKDPAFFITVQEGESPTDGVEEITVMLNRDGAILRLIESGATDRLLWVGSNIEILAYTEPVFDGPVIVDLAEVFGEALGQAEADLTINDDNS